MVTRNSANTYVVPTTADEVTAPAQPAFLAYLGTTDSNVTGDSTTFYLGTGNALTEVFDQNADFVTTGTFTAPVTGRYVLNCSVYCQGFDGSQVVGYVVNIQTSNRAYRPFQGSCNNARDASNEITISGGTVADMDAADIARINITGYSGNKVIDVGSTNRYTCFSGYLAV